MRRAEILILAAGSAALAAYFLSINTQDGETLQTPSTLDAILSSSDMIPIQVGSLLTPNESAFLTTIATSEGADYNTLYGGAKFASFADHPANLNWPGVKLPDALCAGAGFGPGCVSTAAGRYQINRPTWNRVAPQIGATDFGHDAQDAGALFLIAQRGALSDVNAGAIESAIAKVAKVWASFPGSGYGQNTNSVESLVATYLNAGGTAA